MLIKLYNGDCLEYMESMSSNSIDLILTDPPYKIETSGAGLYKQEDKRYIKELEGMKDGFSEDILDEMCRVMKKINIYLFCSQKQIIPLLDYFVTKRKCNYNILSWHKTNPVPACGNKYLTDTEFILFFREKGVKVHGEYASKFTYYVTPSNVADKNKYGHPTIKSLQILTNLIKNSTLEQDIVFDPFMGSGSTGVAAINTGRDFIGIELDKGYYDISEQRINDAVSMRDGQANRLNSTGA